MNASIDVVDDASGDQTASRPTRPNRADERRRIDVTDLDARSVQQFVRRNVGTEEVSLEHRGARTYLVVES